jgi:ADP-heptose:LPS heptosyltransferase
MPSSDNLPWINPIGGYGDMLMISGVLKHVYDKVPEQKYNLIRRTSYSSILYNHPAIAKVGFAPKKAELARVDYWSMEKLGPGLQRPFQILARGFGLSTPVEEKLFIPGEIPDDTILKDFIPWRELNIVISPSSDSPRKAIQPHIWHSLTEMLINDGALVMQVGKLGELHIRNSYSLLGLTTAHQLVGLLKSCTLVITVDNFIMHASHLAETPAVVIWGPTNHKVYGYSGHSHIQMKKACELGEYEDCVNPPFNKGGSLYGTTCPHKEKHCVDQIDANFIYQEVWKTLKKN